MPIVTTDELKVIRALRREAPTVANCQFQRRGAVAVIYFNFDGGPGWSHMLQAPSAPKLVKAIKDYAERMRTPPKKEDTPPAAEAVSSPLKKGD